MKKKQRISDLFYDNRFLLVFSVLAAVAFWLVVVVEFGVEVEREIKGVPVSIDYEKIENDLGLKAFGQKTFTVDITVSGKKYIVEADDIVDDFEVKANTSYVNSAGDNYLTLSVESDNSLYEIVEKSDDEIKVYFDYPGAKEVVVEPEIDFEGEPVAEGYYMGEYLFPESNTVRITGPETEVNKIKKVVARATVDGKLRQNKTVEAELVALNEKGETVSSYITFNKSNNAISLTLPVYKLAKLPLSCEFINRPADYVSDDMLPFIYTVNPSIAEVGVPEKKLESIDSLEIRTIDFSELKDGVNTFKVKASDITNAVVVDGTEEFTVTVTVNGMDSKSIKVNSDISVINAPEDLKYELVKLDFSEITIVGPAGSIDEIKPEDIVLTADLSEISSDDSGSVTVPVTVTDNDIWLYGTYTATLLIS